MAMPIAAAACAAAFLLAACARPSRCLPEGMLRAEGGSFLMGSPEGEPGRRDGESLHWVELSAFLLAARELSFAEYDLFCESTGRQKPGDSGFGRGDRPVLDLSWTDAVAYCNWRSLREGREPCYRGAGPDPEWSRSADGYRLPTEAEWEYACRAGTSSAYAFGSEIGPELANYDGSSASGGAPPEAYRRKTLPAGSFAPNAWGFYDMHGNVWEWCWDWRGPYPAGASKDPRGAATGEERILRGGSFCNTPDRLRSAWRYGAWPEASIPPFGLRLAMNAP